jgi:hypothetical protein
MIIRVFSLLLILHGTSDPPLLWRHKIIPSFPRPSLVKASFWFSLYKAFQVFISQSFYQNGCYPFLSNFISFISCWLHFQFAPNVFILNRSDPVQLPSPADCSRSQRPCFDAIFFHLSFCSYGLYNFVSGIWGSHSSGLRIALPSGI